MAAAGAAPAGYSQTPLSAKLGLKDGQRILFVGLPEPLVALKGARAFASLAEADWTALPTGPFEVIHAFTRSRAVLTGGLPELMAAMTRAGALWVSWPKKASRVETDLTEDAIRAAALPLGLVDVKVCALDTVWSGLKLVIRKELR